MIWVYVQNADARARAAWGQQATVLRATRTIDIGSGPDVVATLVEEVPVPVAAVPPKAIGALDQLQGKAATSPILPGEFLVATQFGAIGTPSVVKPKLMAVTVNLPD